jgi:ATP-dependent protease ClpP protease subunit
MKAWFSFILFLFSYALHADVIYEKLDEKDFFDRPLVKISITGEINIGDYEDLKKYLNEVNLNNYRVKEDSIILNSHGGNMQEARDLGHLIRKHHIATKVNHDDECISACSLIFIAGSCRMAEGFIGLHRSVVNTEFDSYDELTRYYTQSENNVKNYIEEMGAHNLYREIIYNTPNWDVWWLTDLQKMAYGLMVTEHKESYYFQEVVSRKIAAPKQFLIDDLYNKKIDKEDAVTWYEKKILKKNPLMEYPSCTEQMFFHLLEEYPIGTDKWDEEIQIYKSWQGYMTKPDKDEKFQTYYVGEIPYQEGISYFWTLDYFLKGKKELTYKEVTTYDKPTTWSDSDGVNVTKGGRVATRIRTVPNNGRVFNSWTLDKNDPKGNIKVEIFIDEKLVREFQFTTIDQDR